MNAFMFGEPSPWLAAAGSQVVPTEEGAARDERGAGDGFVHVTHLFPELEDWVPVLRRLRFFPGNAAYLATLAIRNRTDFQTELLASGLVSEKDFCRALAAELGIGFTESVEPDRLLASDEQAIAYLKSGSWRVPFRVADKDGATRYLVAPTCLDIGRLQRLIANRPATRARLTLVASATLRGALLVKVRELLVLRATYDLFDCHPDMSARIVVKGWQSLVAGALIVALPVALWAAPGETWFALHLFFSIFFLACVGLRWGALAAAGALPRRLPPTPGLSDDMPVYSLLVALYREAEVVRELVASLERIEWPKNRLEIKLVCEADDRATMHALRSISLPPYVEVVEVPSSGPRTKPKALAFALPLVKGELVALYDAEDHPHPRQLLEAWLKFKASPPDVACVQAPLEIVNRHENIIARMFAFEYASLFRGLLPWLSGRRVLLPLGGTSNHFRRTVLEEVGIWDPFNVTEDADLGVRLARFGYRTETIACPTWEAAPDSFATWLPQRTRWLKGWMQTWLVHMRRPGLLLRELGPGSFLVGQILFAGMVISALAHPLFLATGLVLAVELMLDRPASNWKSMLLAIDIVNVGCGYLSFLLLGWRVSTAREKLGFWKVVLFTPLYWMMMSIAAWRALLQLCRKPHLWEKTPHRPLRAAARPAGPAPRAGAIPAIASAPIQ